MAAEEIAGELIEEGVGDVIGAGVGLSTAVGAALGLTGPIGWAVGAAAVLAGKSLVKGALSSKDDDDD